MREFFFSRITGDREKSGGVGTVPHAARAAAPESSRNFPGR